MATIKIKNLPETISVNDTDYLIIEDTSVTHKASVQTFISYLKNHPLLKSIFVNKDTIGQKNGIAPLNNNTKLDPAYIEYGKTAGTSYSGNDGHLLEEALSSHEGNVSNPHRVSKEQLGLGNAENKSSADIRNELTARNISDAIGYVPEIQGAYENATAYTDMRLGELTGGASSAFDTLKEIEDILTENEHSIGSIISTIDTKLDTAEFDTHDGNTVIHTTQTDKDDLKSAKNHANSVHARTDAAKVTPSAQNGNILINDNESVVYQHPLSGIIPGTYSSVTVDSNGHITGGNNPTLSITRGGTGATNSVDALKNLGIDASANEINILSGINITGNDLKNISSTKGNIQNQLDNKAALNHGNHLPGFNNDTEGFVLLNNGQCNYHKLTGTDISNALGYIPGTGSNVLTAVKGDAETEYRVGNVNLTPENLGIGRVDNTKDSEKVVASANKLTTSRSIGLSGGVTGTATGFDGSSNITIPVTALDAAKLTGTASISSTGNAGTATKLQTARTINNVTFDGTANITITDDTKAPISHAVTSTEYGVGDTTKYGHVKVDNALSTTSTNPVQNKVIHAALSGKVDKTTNNIIYATGQNDIHLEIEGVTEYVDGQIYTFIAQINNTGDTTMQINNLPAKPLYIYGTTSRQVLRKNRAYRIWYNSVDDCFHSGDIKVDAGLSATSIDLVQNNVIYNALAGKADKTTAAIIYATGTDTIKLNIEGVTEYVDNIMYTFKAAGVSTSSITVQINDLPAKPLYLPIGTTAPVLLNHRAYRIWYSSANDCFYMGETRIDAAMSATSRNPVENNVINTALSTKADTSSLGTQCTFSWNSSTKTLTITPK